MDLQESRERTAIQINELQDGDAAVDVSKSLFQEQETGINGRGFLMSQLSIQEGRDSDYHESKVISKADMSELKQ